MTRRGPYQTTSKSELTECPIPVGSIAHGIARRHVKHDSNMVNTNSVATVPVPKKPPYPKPLLRLHISNLALPGIKRFLNAVDPTCALQSAVDTVLRTLYPEHNSWSRSAAEQKPCETCASWSSTPWPGTRSVTLILKEFDGVAMTGAMELDEDHKEMAFSTSYIYGVPEDRAGAEINGVLVHEMVHCFQWTGRMRTSTTSLTRTADEPRSDSTASAAQTAPIGLIEGIADWVRLKAALAPPHWQAPRRSKDVDYGWDAGYERTAFFLEWLERSYGKGSVVGVNMALKDAWYDESKFWTGLFGHDIEHLWAEYRQWLDSGDEQGHEKGAEETSEQRNEGLRRKSAREAMIEEPNEQERQQGEDMSARVLRSLGFSGEV